MYCGKGFGLLFPLQASFVATVSHGIQANSVDFVGNDSYSASGEQSPWLD